MKSFTDIEQSEKLAEILPLKSADMCYPLPCEDKDKPLLEQGGFGSIPCWSLAALIDVSPREMRLIKSTTDDTYHCDCPQVNDGKWYDNPIDAFVEMLESLQKKMVYDFHNLQF